MEFLEVIEKRRSTRRYVDTPVEDEVIKKILDVALTAPSAKNTHSTRFLVVKERETIDKMAHMRDSGCAFMSGVPAAIVVMGDTEASDIWQDNCSISATILQLAAVEYGLGSCWVHVNGRRVVKADPDSQTAEDYLREFLPVKDTYRIECVIALGYVDYTPKPLPEWDKEATIEWL